MPDNGTPVNFSPEERPLYAGDWFKLSREWVTKAETRTTEQATAVIRAVTWFFTLGASGTIVGLLFTNLKLADLNLLLLSVSLVFLFLAYAFATNASVPPANNEYSPNQPSTIAAAFVKARLRSGRWITWAGVFLILGMGSFPLVFAFPPKKAAVLPSSIKATGVWAELNGQRIGPDSTSWGKLKIRYFYPGMDSAFLLIDQGGTYDGAVRIWEMRVPRDTAKTFATELSFERDTLFKGESVFVTLLPKNDTSSTLALRTRVKVYYEDTLLRTPRPRRPADG